MLKRFRRVSTNSTPIPAVAPVEKQQKTTTFFDLPAEIRNQIYELVACQTTLTLKPAPKHRHASPKATRNIPGLLIASRQYRNEALSVLLTYAVVEVKIIDFNFKNLERVISGLYSSELKALRGNKNLILHLSFTQWRPIGLSIDQDLRRWLVKRADGLDRLPWHYVIDTTNLQQDWYTTREFKARLQWLWLLYDKCEDTLQFELLAVIDVIKKQIACAGV